MAQIAKATKSTAKKVAYEKKQERRWQEGSGVDLRRTDCTGSPVCYLFYLDCCLRHEWTGDRT